MAEEKVPPDRIFFEEVKKPIEQVIADEAIRIYKEKTGQPPPKELPKEFYKLAMVNILKRWQKAIKEAYTTATAIFGKPEKTPFEELPPLEELRKSPYTPIVCPKCKRRTLKPVARGVYVCENCGYWISIPKLFPTRRR